MDTIVKMIFGSHLYGTATPTSDKDYKGIFLPAVNQILLNKIPKTISKNTKNNSSEKNTENDVDEELYSLHYFIELACQGQTVAIDMLHAPKSAILETSEIWEDLYSLRGLFYTKNLQSLVGYARHQAAKYGIKGSRLAAAKQVLDYFNTLPTNTKLKDIWEDLPKGDHLSFLPSSEMHPERFYQVCGKSLLETSTVGHYMPMLSAFINEYGKRAQQAEQDNGIDWKAISHAFRAAYQVKAILTEGGFEYPLKETPFIIAIKKAEIPYKQASPILEDLIEEVITLSNTSQLPDKVDRVYWDNWLIEAIKEYWYLDI
jgi:hypothetical protein